MRFSIPDMVLAIAWGRLGDRPQKRLNRAEKRAIWFQLANVGSPASVGHPALTLVASPLNIGTGAGIPETHTAAKHSWAAIGHNADDKGGLMRTFLRAAVLGVVVAGVSGIQLIAQATDPVVGTWELNVAKSKFSPGPAPKSETRTYVVSAQEIKGTAKGVDSEGKAVAMEWTVVDDGKDRPVTGSPDLDMLSIKRIDSHTVESTHKRAGKVVATARRTVSKDGKTLTITTKGTNAKGQAINNVQVFEKR